MIEMAQTVQSFHMEDKKHDYFTKLMLWPGDARTQGITTYVDTDVDYLE